MKIDDDHLYHGSALLQITEHPNIHGHKFDRSLRPEIPQCLPN